MHYPTLCGSIVVQELQDLQLSLQPRLTHAATRELLEMQSLISSVCLVADSPDLRVFRHNVLAFNSVDDDPFATAIWQNFSLQKCSFCGFFSQLHHCNMNSSGQCPFCSGEETCLHLFITYQQSSSFWSFTNIDLRSLPLSEGIESFWQITRIRMTVLLCITWNAWKCRNANIFRHEDEANTHISRRGRDDLHFFSFGPIDVVTP